MAPKYRTGSSKKQKDAIGNRHYSLRAIAATSAACGLLINMVAIANIGRINRGHAARVLISWAFLPLLGSLAWDAGHLTLSGFSSMHASLQIAGDVLAFLGFLAILITNGIVSDTLGYESFSGSTILLLAYDSFPWIICAAMHLFLAFISLLTTLDINTFPRIRVEWPEGRHALLADDEDFDEGAEEVQSKNKGAVDGGNDEESAPLLGSS